MFWDITERRNMNINGAIEVCRMFGLKFDNVRVYQRNVDKALQVLSHAWRIIDRRCDEIKSVEAVAKAE
jgi:hypothetical protein